MNRFEIRARQCGKVSTNTVDVIGRVIREYCKENGVELTIENDVNPCSDSISLKFGYKDRYMRYYLDLYDMLYSKRPELIISELKEKINVLVEGKI